MANIICVSGAQSVGKTITLNELTKRKHVVDEFKASRTVMSTMGISIGDFRGDENLMMKFQNELLVAKTNREYFLLGNTTEKNIFVERSTLDLFAYAYKWSQEILRDNPNNTMLKKWIRNYGAQCVKHYAAIYSDFIFIPAGKFEHVDDGIRADADTQFAIDNMMFDTYKGLSYIVQGTVLTQTGIESRALEIENYLKANYGI